MTPKVDRPTVSVVIPAYNAAWCIQKALDSVLAQSFRDFELLVVDDGSTDDTKAVLAAYSDAIRIVRKPNGGLSSARNAGIREARAALVAFLDADDWWLPDKLSRQVALMHQRPDLGFTSCAALVQDPEGRLINVWADAKWEGSFLVHLFGSNAGVAGSGSAVIARRTLLEQSGGFDESLRSLEDIDMWMRLAAVTDYACIDEPLAVILKRPGSMSRNLNVMRAATVRVMRKNRHLLPDTLQEGYWRASCAGAVTDYAKAAWREGDRWRALAWTIEALLRSPLGRGRLAIALLAAMLRGGKL
jgi:glycosyltransferase involved in cell wall biosynthesis